MAKRNSKFIPPTLRQINDRIREKGYKFVSGEAFFYHYESNGWKVGKVPMKNWEAALAGWESREIKKKKLRLLPIVGKICSKCKMPAVYKNTGSVYDYYFCEEHMPEEVKKKYTG